MNERKQDIRAELMRQYADCDPENGIEKRNGSIFEKSNVFANAPAEEDDVEVRVDGSTVRKASVADIRRVIEQNNQE